MSKVVAKGDKKKEESLRCNHKCFECKFDDCLNDVLTTAEKADAALRDTNYTNYGHIMIQKPTKRRQRNRR